MALGEGIAQLYVFSAFFALGVAVTLPYLFVAGLVKGKVATVISDFICCVGVTALLWKFNLEINNGEFRLFVFAGFWAGAAISCATCKSTLDKLSFRLYNVFKLQSEKEKERPAEKPRTR